MFQLQDVKFKHILHIPQLKIRNGKITCILGESGSGKSTLLKLLNDLHSPDCGTILYQGKPLSSYDPITLRREIVMLGQTPPMFEGNVKDNLLIGLRFSGQEEKDDEVLSHALANVQLNKKLDDKIEVLSGGEKQRLALARIALMKPSVYLLDEPTSALDEQTAHTVMSQFLENAKKEHKTVIMITHLRSLAQDEADDIIEIDKEHRITRKELVK